MDGNKRDFIKDCVASNPTGKHEYIADIKEPFMGETCKFCGLLRSTIEDKGNNIPITVEKPIVSPLSEEMVSQAKKSTSGLVTNDVFDEILRQTNSKSAIIITFDAPLIGTAVAIKSFAVSSVNIKVPDIRHIISFVIDALSGKYGGVFNNNKDKNEKGE